MLHTETAIQRRGPSLLPPFAEGELRVALSVDQRARYEADRVLDQVLADSFPASDPPSWTLGVERSDPFDSALSAPDASHGGDNEPAKSHVLDVSLPRDRERPFVQGLVSLVGAAGIALLVPFVILLVGLPIVLVVRGVAEALAWLLARIVG